MFIITSGSLQAHATKLPAGVVNYLTAKDENVHIRFDGFIIFGNGQSYLPIISQDPEIKSDAIQVIKTIPEGAEYPDLIQFDNNTFLLRLIQTSAGRLTFIPMGEYPFALKTGMLPQDLVLPKNFFVPTELKVILGELPYKPELPKKTEPLQPLAETLKKEVPKTAPVIRKTNLIYTHSLDDQMLVAVNDKTGQVQHKIDIGCIPSKLKMSRDQQTLYAPCLSGNKMIVIDTTSNLIKTKIPLSSRPSHILLLEDEHKILLTHGLEKTLTVIDDQRLLAGESIELPSEGGAMTRFSENVALIADRFSENVYIFDLRSNEVKRSIPMVTGISAMQVSINKNRRPELWVISEKEDVANVYDLITGKLEKSLSVGEKPVAMSNFENKLFVLSTRSATIDVIDIITKDKITQFQLPEGSYPTELSSNLEQNMAYISSSAKEAIYQLNMKQGQIGQAIPSGFRSLALAFAQAANAQVNKDTIQAHNNSTNPSTENNTKTGGFLGNNLNLKLKDTEKAILNPKRKNRLFGSSDASPKQQPADKKPTNTEAPTTLSPMDDRVVITKKVTPLPSAKKGSLNLKGFFNQNASTQKGDVGNSQPVKKPTNKTTQKGTSEETGLPPMLEL